MLNKIKDEINKQIGDDIMDVYVKSLSGFDNDDGPYIRAVCRVYRVKIAVMKPANRWEVIKSIMPDFIRRKYPPKLKPTIYKVPLPAIRKDITKDKLAALIYYTDELYKDKNVMIKYSAEGVVKTWADKIYDNSVNGCWVPDKKLDECEE